MSDNGLVQRGGAEAWWKEWWIWRQAGAGARSLEILRGPLRAFDSSLLEHVFLAPGNSGVGDAKLHHVIGLDALMFGSHAGEASAEEVEERARAILESINPVAVLFALSPVEYRSVVTMKETNALTPKQRG